MYKTIRHGENSLQYTILPQNDDFRIEGKLSSAGSNCTSGKSRKSKTKRPRRRSFFAYLGLIFVCTVIVGAILIPFLVSAECLPNPTEWFLKTKAALTKSNVETKPNGNVNNGVTGSVSGNGVNVGKIIKIINKDGTAKAVFSGNQTHGLVNATTAVANNATINQQAYIMQNSSNISNLNRPVENEIKTPTGNVIAAADDNAPIIEAVQNTIPTQTDTGTQQALVLPQSVSDVEIETVVNDGMKDSQTQAESNNNFVTELRFDSMQQNHIGDVPAQPPALSAIIPTIAVTISMRNTGAPNKINTVFSQTLPIARPTLAQSANAIYSPRLPASNIGIGSQPAAQSASLPTIMTRIIQVPLLKSAAKKPIMPPVLAKTNSQYTIGNHVENVVPAAVDAPNQFPASLPSAVAASSLSTSANEKPTNLVQGATNSNWIHAHWPYIDPSTYFQWTGYKAEDSVLLPALLGFALIGMILIITVCLVARNKRTIVSSVRKRNRNDIEGTGAEDNATLLTTTNLSDED